MAWSGRARYFQIREEDKERRGVEEREEWREKEGLEVGRGASVRVCPPVSSKTSGSFCYVQSEEKEEEEDWIVYLFTGERRKRDPCMYEYSM